jgi:hypothetical protein
MSAVVAAARPLEDCHELGYRGGQLEDIQG